MRLFRRGKDIHWRKVAISQSSQLGVCTRAFRQWLDRCSLGNLSRIHTPPHYPFVVKTGPWKFEWSDQTPLGWSLCHCVRRSDTGMPFLSAKKTSRISTTGWLSILLVMKRLTNPFASLYSVINLENPYPQSFYKTEPAASLQEWFKWRW